MVSHKSVWAQNDEVKEGCPPILGIKSLQGKIEASGTSVWLTETH